MDPDELCVTDDGTALDVHWPDTVARIPAARLRAMARDAQSRRQQIETGTIRIAPGLRITALQPVGAMGVNVCFSDGHDRAIYPWPYLREIALTEVRADDVN
jgi:DUF971 family protein